MGKEVGRGLARRYPVDVGPLAAVESPTDEAYAELATMIPDDDHVIMFLDPSHGVPRDWQVLRDGALVQMICRRPPEKSPLASSIEPLTIADADEMLALATLTEPGPFRKNTVRLGKFFGIRVKGELAAMAGQRTAPTGFIEVSAVCTHPDFRGRGYALALVGEVARAIHADGRVPFLTSYAANFGAIRIYEQAGFTLRRKFELAVLQPPRSN